MRCQIHGSLTKDPVGKQNLLVGHKQPHGNRLRQISHRSTGTRHSVRAACPGINNPPVALMGSLSSHYIRPTATAGIDQTLRGKTLKSGMIGLSTNALAIRAVRP